MYPILLRNNAIINAASMVANATSGSIDVSEGRLFSLQTTWSGSTPVGTLVTQISNDGINWTTLESFSLTGNTGTHFYNPLTSGTTAIPCTFAFLQVSYTFGSGTGTISTTLCLKN